MTYEEIISAVSIGLGLPEKLVDRTYRAYWKAVRKHIASLPLMEDLTDEEFMALQPNVNIPSIGKLYVTPGRYRGMKESYKLRQQLKQKRNVTCKENQATVQPPSCHR